MPGPLTSPIRAPSDGGGVRSLADDLRGRTDAQVAELLMARPDLARPTPGDLTALAARSTTRASTGRAIDALDRGTLDVLTAAAALGGPLEPGALTAAVGGAGTDEPLVAAALDRLWSLALLWGEPTRQVSRTVLDVLGPHVGGLGPTRAALGLEETFAEDQYAVSRILAAAPRSARIVLESLTWGPPAATVEVGTVAHEAASWLAAQGLCALVDGTLTLPQEVGLALRGGRVIERAALTAPRVAGREWDPATVDRTAAGSASELLALVDDVLADWSIAPPRVLKSGGLSARDLARTARTLDLDPHRSAVLLDVALSSGLLAQDAEDEGHWAPTEAYDRWLDEPGGSRWARLVTAWWEMTRDPTLVGTHRDGRLVAALGAGGHRPALRSLRHDVIRAVASLPPGIAPTVAEVSEQLRWTRPRRLPQDLEPTVSAVLEEASMLGLLALGAASTPARLLAGSESGLDGHDGHDAADLLPALAAAVTTHLPAPVSHVLLQADLTAVVPGPTSGSLTHFLRLAADLESRGGATVHRFSEESIRRCLDAGWSADEILGALADASATAIPQPLTYLVQDTARRHGRLRVSAARAVLRADDPSVLESLLANRDIGALQLRRIAPTVAVSPVPPTTVLELLREAGQSAVIESETGAITFTEKRLRRSRPHPVASPSVRRIDEPTAYGIVAGLRSAEGATLERARSNAPALVPTGDPTISLAVLREACADERAVWIGYTDATGGVRRFLFHPEGIDHGRVHGISDGVRRTLSIHRVTGVANA